ncbi:uncharacterized protein ACA1_061320 [Acanthamoeba castellanii str. Neff]|uniref:Secreted protein, putative n=1 Tax=Acanthamoeba castellanii (strain ATCC 30010 / Neff) TaxID=1257118 RepID=L8GVY8_ACACF|nr:uncharacterized protein ACA1_061320 [Acanthamoeba castellanii str. Neff]ELR17394.1 secreted protein, putative [Acanthamoeba castellanii str. Neff]
MTKLVQLLIAVIALVALCGDAATVPTIYVSPSGNDSWTGGSPTKGSAGVNGTVAGPLRTLAAAALVARSRYGAGVTKTVSVAAGTYTLSTTLALTAADSNTLFIAADSRAGKTVISGGQCIPANAFKALDTSTGLGARVPAAARSRVKQVNLTQLGLTSAQVGVISTNLAGMELFFKGAALHVARWPNYPNYVLTGNITNTDEKLVFHYVNATSWPYEGVWVHGFFGQNWFDERRAIESVDQEAKTITLATPTNYAFKRGQRFYYYNVIDELDTAGEYLIDRDNGVLYFYPPSAIASNTDAVLSVLNSALIAITGSNITFSGFTLEATQNTAVTVRENGSGNVIKNCVIRNVGETGVSIAGGTDNIVMTSELYNMGKTGVSMSGGDRKTLTPCNHMAFANHVHDYSRFILCYQPAFGANGVGVKIVNNKIHTAPHNAILLGESNNMEIYFNEIYDMCREASDVGAFYQGRDWTGQGSYISYNYFHDSFGYGSEGVSAIYFDDENSGSTAFGNIIVNMELGILMGGGRSNHVDNNIFINLDNAAYAGDARGLPGQVPQNNNTLYTRLLAQPYQTQPWSTQFPELVTILDDPVSPHAPRYNSYRHNVACNTKNNQRLSTAAAPYIQNVTSDNWWLKNSTTCQKAIFPYLQSTGSLEISPSAPFLANITFSAIPWKRIGLAGAYESLPANLPGLKYGKIVTPQAAKDTSAASGFARSPLALALRFLF